MPRTIQAYINSLSFDERVAVLKSAGFAVGAGFIPTTDTVAFLMADLLNSAVEELDGGVRGPNTQAYNEGIAEGSNYAEQMVNERWAIWNDESLKLDQKLDQLEETGLDVRTLAAMAILVPQIQE